MIHIAIIATVILSDFVEWIRVKAVKGRWVNVPKFWTYFVQMVLCAVVFWIFKPSEWYYIIPEMAFVRGLLYDPVLNKMRGLKWDYVSRSTNSWLDRLEAKIGLHFTAQRILYGVLALTFLLLYEL